jgi:predicted RNA-binding protein (virulence factor B family)
LSRKAPDYTTGHAVELIITGESPLGYNAIVENAHRGLLYRDTLSSPLAAGQRLKAFVRAIRPDGNIDLSLDQAGYKRVAPLKLRIVQALERNGGRLSLDDDSPPEEIRAAFDASKKAFKQALGALYKSRRIRFLNPGIELLDNSSWTPGEKRGVGTRR